MTMSDQTRQQAPVAGTPPPPAREQLLDRMQWFGSRYALIGVWLLMAVIYAFVTPHNFLRISTAQAVFGSQSPLLFLSISALCTFVIGEFDLSFAGSWAWPPPSSRCWPGCTT